MNGHDAFGLAEVSKGLPSAVRAGGGGLMGSVMRRQATLGQLAGRQGPHSTFALRQIRDAKKTRGLNGGRRAEQGLMSEMRGKRMAQEGMKGGPTTDSRGLRAGLLNETSADRRAGYKGMAATSGVKNGFRGRVSAPMKKLP